MMTEVALTHRDGSKWDPRRGLTDYAKAWNRVDAGTARIQMYSDAVVIVFDGNAGSSIHFCDPANVSLDAVYMVEWTASRWKYRHHHTTEWQTADGWGREHVFEQQVKAEKFIVMAQSISRPSRRQRKTLHTGVLGFGNVG